MVFKKAILEFKNKDLLINNYIMLMNHTYNGSIFNDYLPGLFNGNLSALFVFKINIPKALELGSMSCIN
jgi:hypothetical protein